MQSVEASEPTCEVCGVEPAFCVAAVPGVPYSAAYCLRCLQANAHPWWLVVTNTAIVGGYEHAAPWWQEIVDSTISHHGKTRAEFDDAVRREEAQFNGALGD